jgi:hypothetical protein
MYAVQATRPTEGTPIDVAVSSREFFEGMIETVQGVKGSDYWKRPSVLHTFAERLLPLQHIRHLEEQSAGCVDIARWMPLVSWVNHKGTSLLVYFRYRSQNRCVVRKGIIRVSYAERAIYFLGNTIETYPLPSYFEEITTVLIQLLDRLILEVHQGRSH